MTKIDLSVFDIPSDEELGIVGCSLQQKEAARRAYLRQWFPNLKVTFTLAAEKEKEPLPSPRRPGMGMRLLGWFDYSGVRGRRESFEAVYYREDKKT